MEKKRILLVEDERIVARDLARQLDELGYDVVATPASGEEAVAKARELRPDLVLMDIVLAGEMDGISSAERIFATCGAPVIYLTAYGDDRTFGRAKRTAPAGYILKPVEKRQLQLAIELALHRQAIMVGLQQNHARIYRSLEGVIDAIAETVELRGPSVVGHHRRVADWAAAIGRELGLNEFEAEGLALASRVYDIGMVNIPAEILQDAERLDGIKLALYRGYPEAAYGTLKKIECVWPIADIVLQHRECPDGSGFPQGLRGEEILIGARILAVAVALEELTTHRSHRGALPLAGALETIAAGSGTRFDPAVVAVCVRLFRGATEACGESQGRAAAPDDGPTPAQRCDRAGQPGSSS